MKKEVFEGVVDEVKFDDPIKFKEYLEEHKDAKNVSYSHSIREIPDEQSVLENVCSKCGKNPCDCEPKQELDLYPPFIDIDVFVSDPASNLEDVKKTCEDYLKEHKQIVESMDDDDLSTHYDKLQEHRRSVKSSLKQNSQSISILKNQISKLDGDVEKHKVAIEKANSRIEYYKDQLHVLETAGDVLDIEYKTTKQAVADVSKYINTEKEETLETKTRDTLTSLLEDIYNLHF